GRGDWSLNSGATFIANVDDDNGDHLSDALQIGDVPGGLTFTENRVVENDADALDLAWVRIPALGPGYTPGMTAWLWLDNSWVQSVHVFPSTGGSMAGATSILGGLGDRVAGGSREYEWADITPYVSATSDAWFAVEGMFFKNNTTFATSFDGTIDLYVAVYNG